MMEKHSRGSTARCDREARLQGKETRKMLKATRYPLLVSPLKEVICLLLVSNPIDLTELFQLFFNCYILNCSIVA